MVKLKSEKIGGKTIQFHKQYKFYSKHYPSVPYIIAEVDGRELMRADSKEEIVKELKKYFDYMERR